MTAGRPPSRTISTSRPSARSSAAVASALASTCAWSKASRLTLGIRVSASRSARRPGIRAVDPVAEGGDLVGGEDVGHPTDPTHAEPAARAPRVHGILARAPTVVACSDAARPPTTSSPTTLHPEREGAKNRPTPKRKDQEAARKQPLVVADRKQAKQLDKAKRNAQLAKTRQAMLTGDDAGLPARDKGPVRRYIRDYIDARWNLAEFMLPVMLIVLALSFLRTSTILFFVTSSPTACCSPRSLDTFLMWRRLQQEARRQVRRGGRRRQGQRHVCRDARLPAAPFADAAPARDARRVPRLSQRHGSGGPPRGSSARRPSRRRGAASPPRPRRAARSCHTSPNQLSASDCVGNAVSLSPSPAIAAPSASS